MRLFFIKEADMRLLVGVVVCALLVPAALFAQYTPATVYEIQQGIVPVGTDVEVDSVVVTGLDLKPTTYGFLAQEIPGGPWSGVLFYTVGTDPTAEWDIEVGDLVGVRGVHQEYPETGSRVTEVEVDTAWVIVKGYGEPDCQLLSCGDLGREAEDSTFAEQWEGVYICVDTVQVGSQWDYAEWVVGEYHNHPGAGLGDSLIIDDKLVDPTLNMPAVGDTLSLIKGIYSEEHGNYRLWPRGTYDLEFMGPPPGPNLVLTYATSDTSVNAVFDRPLQESSAENKNNYFLESDTEILQAILNLSNMKTVRLITATQPDTLLDSLVVCDVKSAEGTAMFECQKYGFMAGLTPMAYVQKPGNDPVYWDTPLIVNEQVTVKGIVTSASSDFGGPFFMRDDMGPWNSIYIYWPGANVTVGEEVVVSGVVQEYYGFTEISSIDFFWRGTGGHSAIPDSITNIELAADSVRMEAYESCLVDLDSMVVTTYLDGYDEWWVNDQLAQAPVKVGDFAIYAGDSGYTYPGLGSLINIQGCWRYDYGEYKLEPRTNADIVTLVPCTGGVKARDGFRARLDQNSPNPFVAGTTIKFEVPKQARVRVSVYDVAGRLVKDLADREMAPGEYTVSWDGRDSRNKEVGPGIYFYNFTTPERSIQKKMVLLK
jgi:hypothetical protein